MQASKKPLSERAVAASASGSSETEEMRGPVRIHGRLPYNPTIPAARIRKAVNQAVSQREKREREARVNGTAQ
jgi:hypothetical protein